VSQLGLDPLMGRRLGPRPRVGADEGPLLHSCYVRLLGPTQVAAQGIHAKMYTHMKMADTS
jgi:hypothetical protein